MTRVLLVALVLFCVLGGTARADGDPASDYLLGTQVFIPFDLKLPKSSQQDLTTLVRDANASGYTIRVALIGSAYDMGSVTSLWLKPKPYAKFLGTELTFVYKNRLLVVMPNGFGFNRPGRSTTKEYATLSKIKIGSGPMGLLTAAETGVQQLAAASGVTIKRTGDSSGGHSMPHDRLKIIVAAVALLAVAIALRLVLRRKGT
ncbi:MAG TPA: hypothetical protein VGH82_00275 [Gaiellaceae bacterium]|jgi:hypothetical protein